MAVTQENCIRWSQHRTNLQTMFTGQLDQGRFCDITLASADGHTLEAHRNVLCAGSQYFDRLLSAAKCSKDLMVIVKDCSMGELRLIVEFIYKGEISVETTQLATLYKMAKSLQVKGLAEALKLFLFKSNSETASNAVPSPLTMDETRVDSADLKYMKDNLERMLVSQQQVFAALKRTDYQIEQLGKQFGQKTANVAPPQPTMAVAQKEHVPTLPPLNPVLYPKTYEFIRKFQPITKLDQLVELEGKLKDEAYWNEVVDAMKSICGVNCHTEGYNCCYILVDHFFTREFMHTCSWSGGSRSDVRKTEFRAFERTIRLFSQLILMADPRFSETQVHQFFLRILKNSTKRLQVHGLRRRSVMRPRGGRRPRRAAENNDGGQARGSDDTYSIQEYPMMDGDGDDGIYDEDGSQQNADDLFESHSFKVEKDDEAMIDNGALHYGDAGEGASWMG